MNLLSCIAPIRTHDAPATTVLMQPDCVIPRTPANPPHLLKVKGLRASRSLTPRKSNTLARGTMEAEAREAGHRAPATRGGVDPQRRRRFFCGHGLHKNRNPNHCSVVTGDR